MVLGRWCCCEDILTHDEDNNFDDIKLGGANALVQLVCVNLVNV